MYAWMIPALWRHFGTDIVRERHCARWVCLPLVDSCVGTPNSLENVVYSPHMQLQFLPQGRELLGENIGPVRSGTNAFERRVMTCKVEAPPAYKLAMTAAEAYENLDMDKMAMGEAGIKELGELQAATPAKPIRICIAAHLGDDDVPYLFTERVEAEIWGGIDMAEDLPSFCTLNNGGAVNNLNLPQLVIDPRPQSESYQEEDEARMGKREEEQVQYRDRIAQRALHWPEPDGAWTLGSTPVSVPANAATATIPPA